MDYTIMINRRTFLASSAAAAGAYAAPTLRARSSTPNDQIGLGFIGLGGRGNQLLDTFRQLRDVRVTALCEPDELRLAKAHKKAPRAATMADMRQMFDRDDVDTVVIATCNHWHCLAAIWACQAGKDVYVEKPLGHNLWEQEQLVKAARTNKRMVQVGTQQRSSPLQDKAKKLLHEDRAIGKLSHVVVSRIGQREPIGKRNKPLEVPSQVNYDLWLGPAHDKPIYRNRLHYDWHWDWNTGNGEMGNWGVHVLDDVLNVALQDRAGFPTAVYSAGERAAWNDAGNTPNVQVAYFENRVLPVSMVLSNIVPADALSKAAGNDGFNIGYTVFGEGGRFCGSRGHWVVYDNSGKVIKEAKGSSGDGLHQQAFLDAVRTRNQRHLKADATIGHISTAWCHLACIAALEGAAPGATRKAIGPDAWQALMDGYDEQVTSAGVYNPPPPGGRVDVDSSTGQVQPLVSEQAEQLVHRTYRSRDWETAFGA